MTLSRVKQHQKVLLQNFSDFIWDFGKLPFPTHLGKYFIKIGKIRAKIHEIGKIKAIFGLGMTPIYGLKNGQIKSLNFQLPLKKSKAKKKKAKKAKSYQGAQNQTLKQ